jgi:hypothetical protein
LTSDFFFPIPYRPTVLCHGLSPTTVFQSPIIMMFVSLCQPLQEFLRFYHKNSSTLSPTYSDAGMCTALSKYSPVLPSTYEQWSCHYTHFLSSHLHTNNRLVTEQYDFRRGISTKNIAFYCHLFCIIILSTVGRYSLYTSKSSELWLVQNPELHIKVCLKNLRFNLSHNNIYFHAKNQPTNSLNKMQYNTKCNICKSHWSWYSSWTYDLHFIVFYWVHLLVDTLNIWKCTIWVT